jgi:dinuclear metal center YbgI/SA1388 family protein
MSALSTIAAFLEEFAPRRLAEEWDNVGLLVGNHSQNVTKLMTCLTVTPASASEAIESGAELIVTHHPLPFLATKRLTDENTVGRILLELIAAHVAVYSPHTAFDSAREGVNERLASGLGLHNIRPLVPNPDGQGTGRWGCVTDGITLGGLAQRLKQFLAIERLQMVGQPDKLIRTVAVGCGAADELLDAARQNGCDAMVLGEARFHTCLEAEAAGVGLLLPGHFASERFAVEHLAEILGQRFSDIEVWPSRRESDPIRWG